MLDNKISYEVHDSTHDETTNHEIVVQVIFLRLFKHY